MFIYNRTNYLNNLFHVSVWYKDTARQNIKINTNDKTKQKLKVTQEQ